ncbi:alpha-hydroxy acid oxidase [Shinella sp.]|uniref:alpha-hydroxy acid oxidase n=1 Tax=Shinella sp. TaxID=1870904 RepID=UPI0029A09596|nr:alpha-hydroxy acid oxidase [Shinella sp.]MDX3975351.1 alpha-hydroxy acid oxidase [Shinella sp.]
MARSPLDTIVNTDDLEQAARRYLPRMLYDWIAGGAGDERGLSDNRSAFDRFRFMPRYLRDVATCSISKNVLGRSFKGPLGIAPMGYSGLFRPQAELFFAETAKRFDVPYIMSGVSVSSMEAAAQIAGENLWYQIYTTADDTINRDMIRRAEACGCGALVMTVDIPVAAKRERDIRNDIDIPPKFTLKAILDGLLHPAWTLRYLLAGGLPVMENWAPYLPKGASGLEVAKFSIEHGYALQTWDHLRQFRQLWPRALVIKGILHPEDARLAREAGADAIIVSNHGGRQFDRAVNSIDCLPAIRKTVGADFPVMFDGGVRRGSDLLALLCCGVDYIFAGRPFLYGAAGFGHGGVHRVMEIFNDELAGLMRQLGCLDLERADLETFMIDHPGTLSAGRMR